jgi:L-lactate dehydrogenase complex protein LldE
MPTSSARPRRAQLFITCLADSLFPSVGEATVRILERLGLAVEFPAAQTCCGQPAYNGGFWRESRAMAASFLDAFEATAPDPVVAPSGSCVAMLRHGFPALFAGEPRRRAQAEALAARTFELSQFLVDELGVSDAAQELGASFEGRLTYHPACHLTRGLGVTEAPLRLLRTVRGAEVVPLPHAEECCGFGGLFAVKHGDLSGAIVDAKLRNVRATGADALVSADLSCLMHMAGALRRDGDPMRCLHLAEVLAGVTEAEGRS